MKKVSLVMKSITRLLWENIYPLVLVLICLFILVVNYVPGTYLSGWDTLHPEFNFQLSFQRIIFGVFRFEQGLGAVAAHAHMSELPRVIILWLLSLMYIPTSLLRFLFIGSNLIIGVLGIYYFVKYILRDSQHYSPHIPFLGGLFYLFNLGTLQHFFVPFEMFTVQYGALPWLFLTATKYLDHSSKRNLIVFGGLSFLAAPMAFASTLWYAYFLALGLYLLVFFKNHKGAVVVIIVLTLLVNSFWLLPNLYFLISGNAASVPLAKINRIFSEEAYLKNQNYGDIQNALIFKNFLFDWPLFKGPEGFGYLLESWREHIKNPLVLLIGYLASGVTFLGVYFTIKKRNRYLFALLLPGSLAFIFLVNQTPPFEYLMGLLRENISIFKEAFRFPFTKFSIILMFISSCLFAYGQMYIYSRLKKFKWGRSIQNLVIFTALVVFMLPVLRGDLISKYVQVKIPQNYFELFEFMNLLPDGRVATMPVHSFWGWVYYDWGFQGAQFISFGIKQPLMDRDYDRWNLSNENYYRQMSFAVYTKNPENLREVLNKYNIKYLIVDKHVINPGVAENEEVLFYKEIEQLLSQMPEIKLLKNFEGILVYENSQIGTRPLISANKFTQLFGNGNSASRDFAYRDYGTYISVSDPRAVEVVNYPFLDIKDNQDFLNSDIGNIKGNVLNLKFKNLPQNAKLDLADYFDYESSIPVQLFIKREVESLKLQLIYKLPVITDSNNLSYTSYAEDINLPRGMGDSLLIQLNQDQTFRVDASSAGDYFVGNAVVRTSDVNSIYFYPVNIPESEQLSRLNYSSLQNIRTELCGEAKMDQLFYQNPILTSSGFKLIAKNAQVCLKVPLSKFITRTQGSVGSLLNFRFRILSGAGGQLSYCLFEISSNKCVKEGSFLENGLVVDDYLRLSNFDLEDYELRFRFNSEQYNGLNEASIEDIQVKLLSAISSVEVDVDRLKNFLSGSEANINPERSLAVELPTFTGEDFVNVLKVKEKMSFCSNFVPKEYDRRIISELGFVEYSAIGGSSCDFYAFPNLSHDNGYILTLEAKNLSGLPLRVCVANPLTKRCEVYSSLSAEGKLSNKQTILIPPVGDGGKGYNIHFDNYSPGEIKSVNRLKQLVIKQFPYNWLSEMRFVSQSSPTKNNDVLIKKADEYFPGLIKVGFYSPSEGLVSLNYSYEKGWMMWGGQKVLVNGWANGWIVGKGEGSRYIFYLPQLLEFIGLTILFILAEVAVLNIVSYTRDKNKSRN